MRRLVAKRSERVVLLSFRLAHKASLGKTTRNAARRQLLAEVVLRYGRDQARRIDARLLP